MNADVAKAARKLTPVDFTDSQYLPKAVNPKKYTTAIVPKKGEDGPTKDDDSIPTLAIDEGQKNLLDSINNSAV